MNKVAVVYWSGTGNTQQMAEAVEAGAKNAGAGVSLFTPSQFSAGMMDDYGAVAFGCPSMGVEELEDAEFEPMFSSLTEKLSGKKIGLFGSYGWGDGEWMRNWEASCREMGAELAGESVIAQDAPDDEAQAQCEALGAALAND